MLEIQEFTAYSLKELVDNINLKVGTHKTINASIQHYTEDEFISGELPGTGGIKIGPLRYIATVIWELNNG